MALILTHTCCVFYRFNVWDFKTIVKPNLTSLNGSDIYRQTTPKTLHSTHIYTIAIADKDIRSYVEFRCVISGHYLCT
jgi:hypothetical protein